MMPAIEWFPYLGPNRRSDLTVIEVRLNFGPQDAHGFPLLDTQVRDLLVISGILTAAETFPRQTLPVERMAWYASLLAQTALLLQCKAGHRLSFFSVTTFADQQLCIALVEHEHCDVGMTAVKFAWELLSGEHQHLAAPFSSFRAFALERLLPIDTGAIIQAAHANDIPCIHLERHPRKRDPALGDCIRLNGLLLLGHGQHQQTLDGTFCPDKSACFKALLNNYDQRQALLRELGVVRVNNDTDSTPRAGHYHIVVINGQLIGIKKAAGRLLASSVKVHPSLIKQALTINHGLGHAPVAVTVLAQDVSRSLTETSGGVVDFELAPDLGHYFAEGSNQLSSAAIAIIDWLFPVKGGQRMPIIAVTGTNGKTTTSRMINQVLQVAGRKSGLVCTDGIILNGEQVVAGDNCTISGHFDVLSSKAVDFAVLEAHHFGILEHGFIFRCCDVAVCLNVTGDHLGVKHIETVEEMAEAKGSLLARARCAAVLNADDPNCLAMLKSITAARICLVSMQSCVEFLRAQLDSRPGCFCVLEAVEENQWLVLYDDQQRFPVLAVAEIPATFNGTARFNTSNAMHAMAACYLSGIPLHSIENALRNFRCSYESTPGRLNVFDELPFRIILDFAHNPDGVQKLCDFVDQQQVTGRKVVAFAGTGNRKDAMLINMGEVMAGHFDFYFCKEHAPREKNPRKVAQLLQQGLLNAGVDKPLTAVRGYGKEVIFEIFDSCRQGDFLVLLLGEIEKQQLPAHIREYSAIRC